MVNKNRYEHLSIRVLRAMDAPDIARTIFEGQKEVLKSFKVDGISSAQPDWINSPLSFIVVAVEVDSGELAAALRLDIADPEMPIPLESAISHIVSDLRPRVLRLVSQKGIAEMCGLFVRRRYSGRNLPKILARAALSVASLLRIYHIVGFFNDYSLQAIGKPFGFTKVSTLGDTGVFEYPDARYLSTVMEMDTLKLTSMPDNMLQEVVSLRERPLQTVYEMHKDFVTEVDYDLTAYSVHHRPKMNWERVKDINIKVLRAVDHPEIAKVFDAKQRDVYGEFDMRYDYSIRERWYEDPLSYMIIAENKADGKIGAGIRLEVADLHTTLSIENATGIYDREIESVVEKYKDEGIAEACGLWVGKSFSERGLPKILLRALIVASSFLRVKHLIAIANRQTDDLMKKIGFYTLTDIGSHGQIHYLNRASEMMMIDTDCLPYTDEEEKDTIFDLREFPIQSRTAYHKRYVNHIHYDLVSYARQSKYLNNESYSELSNS